MVIPENVRTELRRRHQTLEGRVRSLLNQAEQGARPRAWVEEEVRRLRAEAHASGITLAEPVLEEATRVERAQAEWSRPGAALKVVELLRRSHKNPPDPARLSTTSTAELEREALQTDDLVEAAERLRVLQHRVETGVVAAEGAAARVELRVGQLVGELPNVRTGAAEAQRLAAVAESLNCTLEAIANGGEDRGIRYQQYEAISAQRARGDIQAMKMRPDGTLAPRNPQPQEDK
jgi:hypothetical protein